MRQFPVPRTVANDTAIGMFFIGFAVIVCCAIASLMAGAFGVSHVTGHSVNLLGKLNSIMLWSRMFAVISNIIMTSLFFITQWFNSSKSPIFLTTNMVIIWWQIALIIAFVLLTILFSHE